MHKINDVIKRLDFLTERTEGLARDIRVLSNDLRRLREDDRLKDITVKP